ncbi:BrnT family toxin [Castellaniella sp. S9]|uniref:BrnT family toxin n=1 Tax=Castellaniella sp. S9 TaxID=2993652 RepID=UPI0022B3808C|nr:BrnT family toxin [Castellaniella sp. S9]
MGSPVNYSGPYAGPLSFQWDRTKSDVCLQDRGFDFAYAAKAFFDPCRIIRADERHSYGEDRYQLMGKIGPRLFVVVYTPRCGVIRIISARKANQREVAYYENSACHH